MALAPIFAETYEAYLSELDRIDIAAHQDILGYGMRDQRARIPFFNRYYDVGGDGIFDDAGGSPNLSTSVVLCRYLLMCPDEIPQGAELAAFRDFKDAGPLVGFFANSIQGEVVRRYTGNAAALEEACARAGGEPYVSDIACQVKYRFQGLPRIPVYLLFNDAEEGFAAQCTVLFEKRAASFLDMESVAMLGGALVQLLVKPS